MKTGQRSLSLFLYAFLLITHLSAQIPQRPFLISPSNFATDVSLTPTLDWSTVVPHVTYILEIWDFHSGTRILEWTGETSVYTVNFPLLVNEKLYMWRVRAFNNYGSSAWSEEWEFTCAELVGPQLLSPPDGATGVSITPTLSWSEVIGAHHYEVILIESTDPVSRFYYENLSGTSITIGPLNYNMHYRWMVKSWGFITRVEDRVSTSTYSFTTMENVYSDFAASPNSGPAPLTVQFTDQSSGNVTGWWWDFGDGNNSMDQNPSHTYENPGTYTVSLTVTGPDGSNTKTKGDYITVSSSSSVTADFSAAPTSGPAPQTVQFTDQSSGTITGRTWDFGDGSTSTAANPLHTYAYDGIYSVSLTVLGSGGSNTKTRTDYITVSDNMLRNGNFSDGTDHWPLWRDPSVSVSGAVQEDAYVVTIANGGSLSYDTQLTQLNLNLENGETYDVSFDAWADAPRQIIPYMTMGSSPWTTYGGYQPVTLSTEKQNFTYSFTMNHPTDPNARIAFDLGASNTDVTFDNMFLTKRKPLNLLFNAEFSHGVCGWDFYVFSPAEASGAAMKGEYHIAITNGGANGWDVHLQQQVLIENGVTYTFSFDAYAASPRKIIPFVAMSGDPWTIYGYRELMITTAKQTYSYSFTMNHATNPDARVVFDLGNSTTDVYLDNIVLIKKSITSPSADFSASPTSGTAPLTVQFTNQSSGHITSRQWDFGDGETSRYDSPSHTYQSAGTYTVKLTVTGPGGSDTKTRSDYITVTSVPNSGGLLLNGDFSNGATHWHLWHGASAAASGAVVNGEYAVTISNGGINAWDVQLVQTDLKIENGKTYTVSFDAYADADRQIGPYVGMAGSPWTVYSLYQTVDLSTTKQTYTYAFTMNEPTDPEAQLVFNHGSSNIDVYLDNVVLQEGSSPVEEEKDVAGIPEGFILHQNSPNPFNPSTEIRYRIAGTLKVTLRIFDVSGKEIESLVDQVQSPGQYTVTFHANDLPSGIYFYRLDAGSFAETKKLILLQ